MQIYLQNGYLDIHKIISPPTFHTIIMVGPRGSGKSFGVLKDLCVDNPQKFIYMRTMQVELELMSDPDLNPFNALNNELNTGFTLKNAGKYVKKVYEEDSKTAPQIALACALSTVYHARGMDASQYKVLFYDEIIPEPHIKNFMREQYKAIKGSYETLNRNRELHGHPPMKLIMCGNSDDINNDVLAGYHLIDELFRMRDTGTEIKDFPERGLRVVYPLNSPIAKLKRQTANYQGDKSSYTSMALGNEFTGFFHGNIKSMNLKNFSPKVRIGELGIFKSKSDRLFYVSQFTNMSFPDYYGLTDYELKQFRYKYIFLNDLYLRGNKIYFENAFCEITFNNLFKR